MYPHPSIPGTDRRLLVCLLLLTLFGCGDKNSLPTCQVKRVADGDSVDLDCGGETLKVRLYGIDAPELAQRPWGDRSKEYLKAITHKQVLLEKVDIDRYGRTVGELFSADSNRQNFNIAMVMAGQARVYRKYCKRPDYLESEEQARSYRIGIWSKPGLHQRPWQYRRRNPRR